jgi:hypothetical protein
MALSLTPDLLGRLVGAAIAAAVGAGAGVAAGFHANDQLTKDVAEIRRDVRLLKCVNGFPGDCPRQAKVTPP